MDDEEHPLPTRTVICHTAGCMNKDLAVTIPCLDSVICAPCGQLITDITTH